MNNGKTSVSGDKEPVHELSPVSEQRDTERQQASISAAVEAEDTTSLKSPTVSGEVPEGITRIENVTQNWNRFALAGVYFTYV